MGKLINIDDIGSGLRREHYLPPDEPIPYNSRLNPNQAYEDRSKTVEREYPYISWVQREDLPPDPRFWIDLRKLVERRMDGDLVYWYDSLDYKWCWNRDSAKSEYDRKYDTVRHGYWHFCFEFDEDRTIFALLYADIISLSLEEDLPGMMKAPKGEYRYGGW